MKIIRDGVEIELTPAELRAAYEEEKDNIMTADIEGELEAQGKSLTPKQLEDALHLYKKGIEWDDTWLYVVQNAISEVYDPFTAPVINLADWIKAWAEMYGYSKDGGDGFWDFFNDMKSDVQNSHICAERRAQFESEEEFDDWYDDEFLEMAKPIMTELFGYTKEDME